MSPDRKKLKIDTTVKYWHLRKACRNGDAHLLKATNIDEKELAKIASVLDLDKVFIGGGVPKLEYLPKFRGISSRASPK